MTRQSSTQPKEQHVTTTADLIALTGIEIHDHLDRELSIPVHTGAQRQGDVIVLPSPNAKPVTETVPREGVPVVRGENGGNTHLLLVESGSVCWSWAPTRSAADLLIGHLTVGAGSVALLAHPEHGFMAIGPGTYRVNRQREMRDILARVQD